MITFLGIAFGTAIGLALLLCLLTWALMTKFRAGLWLVIVYVVLYAALGFNPRINIGLNFYFGDLVFVLLGGAAVTRLLLRPADIARHAVWIAYGGLLFLSFVRGVPSFGVSAGNELREFYYFFSCALYFATFRYSPEDLDGVFTGWLVAATAIMAVVTFRWAVDTTGIDIGIDPRIWAPLSGSSLRVIGANQALLLASAAVILAYRVIRQRAMTLFSGSALAIAILYLILLQHRSVWVAMLVGFVAIVLLEQRNRARSLAQLAGAGVLLMAVVVPLSATGKFDTIGGDLSAAVMEASQSRGSTFTWRLQSAKELTKDLISSGPVAIALGKPMGSGYDRTIEDSKQEIHVAPHNYYVQIMVRVGIIGVGVFVLAFVLTMRRLLLAFRHDSAPVDPRPLIVLLAMQLTYFIPYSGDPAHAILLGVALSVAAASWASRRDAALVRPREAHA